MIKHYKEKHLQATLYKIENVKREQNFLLRNKWKVIVFGVLFSFWAPTYTSRSSIRRSGKILLEKQESSYVGLAIMCTIVYVIMCLLYHFSSKYQDKKRLKKLMKLKSTLEEEIKELS